MKTCFTLGAPFPVPPPPQPDPKPTDKPGAKRAPGAIRRIFNNDQVIERFGQWLLVCGKAANTRRAYTDAAKQFAKSLINKPLTAATRDDVRAFLGSLYTKGLAATTIQARLDALRVLGDCLQLGSQARTSVPRYIVRRKLPKRLPRAKSEEEIKRLIAAARTPRDLAIVELGYAAGLRVSELANLRVEDIHLSGRSLIVRQGKGDDRVALFGRPAAAALRAYIGDRRSGRLFLQHPVHQRGWLHKDSRCHTWFGQWRETDDNGKRVIRTVRLGGYEIPNKERAKIALDAYLRNEIILPKQEPDTRPLGTKGVYRAIVATAARAGLVGVTPHTLRHSCATHCLDHGMDVRHVQEVLGHASIMATQKYLHVSVVNLQKIHAKFFPRG